MFFLPMIDMDPSDMTCINSTLSFITDHTPVVTFDQPLWLKAQMVISNEASESKLKSIVLRLGGLHVEMNFLGRNGHLTARSGIEEVPQLVYAKNAVLQILSGKAVARAVRGHLLIDADLNSLLVSDTFDLALSVPRNQVDADELREVANSIDSDLESAKELFQRISDDPTTREEVCFSEILNRIARRLQEKKCSLLYHRTAVLWLEYMKMVETLRLFIKAKRTGNWPLHLKAIYDMLPYFAAARHNLYTKLAYI